MRYKYLKPASVQSLRDAIKWTLDAGVDIEKVLDEVEDLAYDVAKEKLNTDTKQAFVNGVRDATKKYGEAMYDSGGEVYKFLARDAERLAQTYVDMLLETVKELSGSGDAPGGTKEAPAPGKDVKIITNDPDDAVLSSWIKNLMNTSSAKDFLDECAKEGLDKIYLTQVRTTSADRRKKREVKDEDKFDF